MRRALFVFLFTFLLAFFFVPFVYSATISSSGDKSQLGLNDELNVALNLSISATDGTQYYLRGLLYKSGTSNYCGYTWNGSNWFSGPYSGNDGWKSFLPVSIQGSSWSGTLKVKINPEDTGCRESGAYSFKVQRFTQSGSGTVDDQNELSLSITVPTTTLTPGPTAKSTSTPTVRVTTAPVAQTTTAPPTTYVMRTSPAPSKARSIKTVLSNSKNVLGESTRKDVPTPTHVPEDDTSVSSGVVMPPLFLTGGILVIVAACGILLFREWNKQKAINL